MKTYFISTLNQNNEIKVATPLTKKEIKQWLYKYLTTVEKLWAWEQWQFSPYKTFNKWFKHFIQKPHKGKYHILIINKTKLFITRQ